MKKSKRKKEYLNRIPLKANSKQELLFEILKKQDIEPNTLKASLVEQLIERTGNCLLVRTGKLGSSFEELEVDTILDLEDEVVTWLKNGYKRDSKKVGFIFSGLGTLIINYLIQKLTILIIDWYLRHPKQIQPM